MNPVELQKQIRDNASDLQSYLKDLESWKDEMKRKESDLLNASDDSSNKNIPPPRKIPKPKEKDSTVVNKEKNEKTEKIKSFDYASWDKYDVDAELKKVEQNETDVYSKDSSSECVSSEEDEQLRDEAVYEKEKGNNFVKMGRWKDAISCYTKAISNYAFDPIFYANRALCYLKLENYKNAETDCTTALQMDKTYVKAYQRRAAAKEKLGQLQEAVADLEQVLAIEPKNYESRNAISRLEKLTSKSGSIKKVIPSSETVTASTSKDTLIKEIHNKISKNLNSSKSVDVQIPSTSKEVKPPNISSNETPISIKWPLGNKIKKIHSINKPPHQRSNKPLKKVEIKQINLEDQINKSLEPQLNSGGKDVTNSKSINLDESENRPEKKIESENPLIKLSSNISKTTELISDEEETLFLKNYTVPKTFVQFYSDWKLIKDKSKLKYFYFRNIPPKNLSNIFKESLESDVFTDILEIMKTYYISNKVNIYDVLNNLTGVKRFSTLTMFMSSKDKIVLNHLFDHLRNSAGSEYSADNVNVLITKYEM